jgi:hypothetical protein
MCGAGRLALQHPSRSLVDYFHLQAAKEFQSFALSLIFYKTIQPSATCHVLPVVFAGPKERGIRLFTVHVRRGPPDVQDPGWNSLSKLNCISACIQVGVSFSLAPSRALFPMCDIPTMYNVKLRARRAFSLQDVSNHSSSF